MIIWFYQLSLQCKLATVKRLESFFESLYSCQFTLSTQLVKPNKSYPGHFQELLKQHRENWEGMIFLIIHIVLCVL